MNIPSVPWLIVSPHCDDGVFACGELLASHPGSVVVTVFAGSPPRGAPLTDWDRACGFSAGEDVMAVRRAEDERALRHLAARPVWLRFLDRQYGPSPEPSAVAHALLQAIEARMPQAIAFPLGLFHSDHILAREAMLALLTRRVLPPAVMYVDALYRGISGIAGEQKAVLARRGYRLMEKQQRSSPRARMLKREAVAAYASQLRALATPGRLGHGDAYAAEAYLDVETVACHA